jgi:hypothetical protein
MVWHQGIGWLGEKEGWFALRVLSHFARVRGVITADAKNPPHREALPAPLDFDAGLMRRGKHI